MNLKAIAPISGPHNGWGTLSRQKDGINISFFFFFPPDYYETLSVLFSPKASLLKKSLSPAEKKHNRRIWQPLIHNQFIAHKEEKERERKKKVSAPCKAANGSQTAPLENYYHSLPHPPEKLFLISTESKRRLGVIKWIMVWRNCRLGWETSPYGFLSNYKGRSRTEIAPSFHPQPRRSLDEAAVSLDLTSPSTWEPGERERESPGVCFHARAPLFFFLCSIHIYIVPGKVRLGFSRDEKKKEGTIHYVIELVWIHGPGIRGNWQSWGNVWPWLEERRQGYI